MKSLIDWFRATDNATLTALAALLTIVTTIATKFIPPIFRWIRGGIKILRQRIQTNRQMPEIIDAYRRHLEHLTLGKRHAWMPPNGTIDNLLVPVQAQTDGDVLIEIFEFFLSKFRDKETGVTVITGPAGAGKSVALGVIVRAAWESFEGSESGRIGRSASFMPVLLRFSDFVRTDALHDQSIANKYVIGRHIEATLLKSLERNLFAHGYSLAETIRGQFLSEWIAEGRLLILVDGLDEVSKANRQETLLDLLSFVGGRHFCILSCRDEVFPELRQVLEEYGTKRLRLAGFTHATSERFLRKWAMVTGQNTGHLEELVADHAALRRVLENPLLLTIACFLLGRDNPTVLRRITDFYRECSDALLLNWDRESGSARTSSQRQSFEKRILAMLGRWRATAADSTAISRDALYRLIRGWLREELGEASCPIGLEITVLDDLMVHSGLLVAEDTGHVDFLHRTFMEYFAAVYYSENPDSADELMGLWKADPVRFERVALFYCALAENSVVPEFFISNAVKRADVRFSISILTQARNVSLACCRQVIDAIRGVIASPTEGLIEGLGDLSRCGLSQPAAEALAHLRSIVESPAEHPQSILEAALREVVTDSPEGIATFMACKDFVRMPLVISGLRAKTIASASRHMLADESSSDRIREWIECLRQVERLGELCAAFTALRDADLRQDAALALAVLSETDGFWHALDRSTIAAAPSASADRVFERWRWPQPMPATEQGKRVAVAIASCLASSLSDRELFPFKPLSVTAHRWLYFLIHAIAWENSYWSNPARKTATRNEAKIPIVGMMVRSMPRLVRLTWRQHATLKGRRPSRGVQVAATIIQFSPVALVVATVLQVRGNVHALGRVPLHAWFAGLGLLVGDLLGWSRIMLSSGRISRLRTSLDVVVSTLLGPAYVLRELPNDVRYKRGDDRFVIAWAVAMITLMSLVVVSSVDIVYTALAVLVCLDTLIQSNRRLGVVTLLSPQCDAMTQYLVSGGRSDAY